MISAAPAERHIAITYKTKIGFNFAFEPLVCLAMEADTSTNTKRGAIALRPDTNNEPNSVTNG